MLPGGGAVRLGLTLIDAWSRNTVCLENATVLCWNEADAPTHGGMARLSWPEEEEEDFA